MAELDPHVASVLDRETVEDRDEDALIEELENEEDMDAFREKRIEQLHEEYTRAQVMQKNEYGTYSEIRDEKTLMDITTSAKLCVVHFFKSDFNRCRIMDGHLEALASKHFDTRFLRIDVSNAPFLVVKLKVQVLPCVLAFHNGVSADRITGFEGLGNGSDNFTTRNLEARLLNAGVLVRSKVRSNAAPVDGHKDKYQVSMATADDDDWD